MIEFAKNTLDLILASKNNVNKIIYPKPLQFLNQYKKILKIITLTISHRLDFSLKLKITLELSSLINKKSSLYLQKQNIQNISVKNRSLKYYR